MPLCRRLLLLTAFVSLPTLTFAQEKKKPADVFTNAADAGIDFKIQGEYAGEQTGGGKVGCQVIALGNGTFQAVLLPGGLPGAGWDGKDKSLMDGKIDGTKAAFTPTTGNRQYLAGAPAKFSAVSKFPPPGQQDYSGTCDGETFSITGKAEKPFNLKKVIRKSPTLGAKPPEGAMVLFDGKSADEWAGGKIVEGDLLWRGTNSKKGITTGKLHVEFRTPFQPPARGQGRGNSGVYIHGVEIQVLDSFGLDGVNNECGAFYSNRKPDVNMCLPPLSWQTYEVDIKTNDKNEIVATVLFNGVKVHENFVLKKGPVKPAIINLQDHGNPVVYRNIWFAEAK